jgi:DNA-binding transcriptional LysR family regulator
MVRRGKIPDEMTDTRKVSLASEYGIRAWDDLRLFLAVVRAGHFLGAARTMQTNQTTVARRFRRMEESLGAKLLERFGQELKLTKSGAEVFERAIAMEALTKEVNDRVRAMDVRPGGTVKIAVTEGLASLWLTPRLAEFCRLYPEINLEVIPSHGEFGLLSEGADVAIGWRRPDETRLVGSRIGTIGFSLFASQSYVQTFGEFSSVGDTANHSFLQYDTHEFQRWNSSLMRNARALDRVKLRTSSVAIYVSAVHAGVGIGHLPTFYRHSYPELITLPVELSETAELWIVSHEETNNFRRTRLLLDFLRSDFRKNGRHLFIQKS